MPGKPHNKSGTLTSGKKTHQNVQPTPWQSRGTPTPGRNLTEVEHATKQRKYVLGNVDTSDMVAKNSEKCSVLLNVPQTPKFSFFQIFCSKVLAVFANTKTTRSTLPKWPWCFHNGKIL